MNNNRWWESYLVRYLLGNIFAILILFYLFINYDKQISKSFCKTNNQICKKIEDNKTTLSKELYGLIFQSSKEISGSNKLLMDKTIIITDKNNNNYTIVTTDVDFISLIIIGIFAFLYMYISSILIYIIHIFRGGIFNFYKFYKESAKIRDGIEKENIDDSTNKKVTKTYIESYKHLREHGNAYSIVLMELLFTFLLICFDFSIYFLICWLMVGAIGWLVGFYLETQMVLEYTNNKDTNIWRLWLIFYILILPVAFLYAIGKINL
jgi:hypothetical protein